MKISFDFIGISSQTLIKIIKNSVRIDSVLNLN